MPIEITMPRLSDTMEEGTLIKWHVSVGDKVQSGDVLADVETDKATMELQSYDEGTVTELALAESETVPVGQLILVLAEEGESVAPAEKSTERATSPQTAPLMDEAPSSPRSAQGLSTTTNTPQSRIRISPVARKLAEEHGLELSAIRGTGPDGRIIKRNVLATLETLPPPARAATAAVDSAVPTSILPEAETLPLSTMRKVIARRLVESKTTIPHFTVTLSIDMAPLLDLRKMLNAQLESRDIKLSVNDFVVAAVARGLAEHPSVNTSWSDEGIVQHGAIHVGVAVALPPPPEGAGGLVVPVIRDTDRKSLRQISTETKALAAKARDQGLTTEEMGGGTFTISNLGMLGVEHFEAIINPPQAAILAVGSTIEKPVVRNGQVVVGLEMSCTLSADHRIVDGAIAAAFLQTIKRVLETPAAMLV